MTGKSSDFVLVEFKLESLHCVRLNLQNYHRVATVSPFFKNFLSETFSSLIQELYLSCKRYLEKAGCKQLQIQLAV